MTVTHKGREYTVTRMADGLHWQLVEVGSPRKKVTLNRDQMVLAGLAHVVEEKQ